MFLYRFFDEETSWTVEVFANITLKSQLNNILEVLKAAGFNKTEEVYEQFESKNCGTTITNSDNRICVVLLFELEDPLYFYQIIPHEFSHVEDRVAEYNNLDTEGRAYFKGRLFKSLYTQGFFHDYNRLSLLL